MSEDRSHIFVDQKICIMCEKKKGQTSFALDDQERDGLYFLCRDCERRHAPRNIKRNAELAETDGGWLSDGWAYW